MGDALGAPIEFASLREIRARFGAGGLQEFAPGFGPSGPSGELGAITDDTQMTLFTAEGLILAARDPALAGRSGMVRSVHRAYLRWLRTQGERSEHPTFERTDEGWLLGIQALHSPRDPGTTCLSALRGTRMGSAEQPLNRSKGCGGVMRIAPVGLTRTVDDPFAVGCAVAAMKSVSICEICRYKRPYPIASTPRVPVLIHTQSSRPRMNIFPSPISPVRAPPVMASIAGSTKSSFTAISSFSFLRKLPTSLWPR